jgi:hypothetical protein
VTYDATGSDDGAYEAEDVSDHGCDRNESNSSLGPIGHTRCSLLAGLTGASARRNLSAKLARRLTKDAFKGAIKLRQRLKANVVCDFANAEVRV